MKHESSQTNQVGNVEHGGNALRDEHVTMDDNAHTHQERASNVATNNQSEDSSPSHAMKTSPIPAHKMVEALRIQPKVEFHRSRSGRNLRLKHIAPSSREALMSPLALTPRAPSERRPPQYPHGHRFDDMHLSQQMEHAPERSPREDNNLQMHLNTTQEHHRSVAETHDNQDVHGENKVHQSLNGHARRSSFSISEKVLYELGFLQSPTQPQVKKEVEPAIPATSQDAEVSDHREDSRGVYHFALWKKATKRNVLPPDAISHAPQEHVPTKNTHDFFQSRPTEEIKSASAEFDGRFQQLHIESDPGSGRSGNGDYQDAVSLARSTSPNMGKRGPNVSFSRKLAPLTSAENASIVKWKRGERIGEGTFGKVYKGLNSVTGELFALKEIEIRSCPNADQMKQVQKFGEEIALMRNLSHKHIVRYKGSHRTDKYFYIFMEYVPGGSIASMLKQFDAFSEDLIRIFTRQIVEGVRYLHSMGIIHRDIKGANVLVTEQGVPKLADFGCSKQLPQIHTTSLEESLRSIRGSIPWMAPEVVKQTGHGFKADIWSIGATVIEMATAQHPWPTSTNSLSAMYAIATARSPPPLPGHLSREAIAFLERCFCIDPHERATAEELLGHPFLNRPQEYAY